jgi:hypothetical protein
MLLLGWWPGCFAVFIALFGPPTIGILISGLIGVLLSRLLHWLGVPGPTERLITLIVFYAGPVIGFLLGLCLLVAYAVGSATEQLAARQAIARDLADDQVEVLRCTVLDAVEVDGLEDTGPGYFLDLGDSTLLYLQGQYLDEFVEQDRFPNREIRIVRTPHAELSLSFECSGEGFEPSRVLELSAQAHLPEDGEILSGRLDTLEEDLSRSRRRRRS